MLLNSFCQNQEVIVLLNTLSPFALQHFFFAYTIATLKGGNVLGAMVMKLLGNFHLVWK